MSWDDAQKSCKRKGGILIVPSSEKELYFISQNEENVWIGANDKFKGKWYTFKEILHLITDYSLLKEGHFVFETKKDIPKGFWHPDQSNIY